MNLPSRIYWAARERLGKLAKGTPGLARAFGAVFGLVAAVAAFAYAMVAAVLSALREPTRSALRTLLANRMASAVVVVGVVVITLLLVGRSARDQPQPDPEPEDRPSYMIGAIVSLTGELSRHGNEMLRGYETAIRAYNTAGGIRIGDMPHNLALVVYDDESSQIRAGEVARVMVSREKPPIILGPYSSGMSQLVLGVADEGGVPVVAPVASAAGFARDSDDVFLIQTPPRSHLVDAARIFAEQVRGRRAELVDDDERFAGGANPRVALSFGDDPHSSAVRAGVLEVLGALEGVELFDFDLSLPDEQFDEAKAELGSVDAMFVSAYAQGATRLIETVATDGINIPFLALTHCDIARIARLQPFAAEGALCAIHWQAEARFQPSAPLAGDGDLRAAYFDEYGSRPSQHAVAAAAAIQVIAAALNRQEASGTPLAEALRATDIDTAYGPVRFDPAGRNVAKPMVTSQIAQSLFVPVAPAQVAQRAPTPTRPQLATSN